MAPAKRAAPKSPPRSRKVQKTAELTPFEEACEAFGGLLDEHAGLPDSAVAMLKGAARLALQPPQASRHKFQTSAVGMLSDIFHEVENAKKQAVEELEQKRREIDEKQDVVKQSMEAANAKKESLVQARDVAEKGMAEAAAAVTAAKEAMVSAKKVLEDMKSKNEQCKGSKLERELFITDVWAKLKDHNFSGKEWRLRNKQIDTLVAILEDCHCEKSLLLGLPVAIKEKPGERAFFAAKTIEFAEAALNASVKAFEDKLNKHDAEVAEQDKVIAEAEAALEKAEAQRDAAETAFVTTENNLLAVTDSIATDTDALNSLKMDATVVASDLTVAKEELKNVSGLLVRFAAVVENGAAGAEPPPPAPPIDTSEVTETPKTMPSEEVEMVVERTILEVA